MRRLPALDGVRCVAVLIVLMFHLGVRHAGGCWLGVDLFFVLSGYLITTILLTEHARRGRVRLRTFYAKRALRLYPALLGLLVVGIPFYRTLGDQGTVHGYWRTAAQAALYVEDFVYGITGNPHGYLGHTWSLAVEEQFYLVWPLLLIVVLRLGGRALPVAVAGTLALWGLLLAYSPTHDNPWFVPASYYLPHTRGGSLMVGCALAAWLFGREPRPAPNLAWLGALGYVAVVLLADRYQRNTATAPAVIAADVATTLLIYGLVTAPDGAASRALSWQPLTWLGERSYGFYLYAFVVQAVLEAHYPHMPTGRQLVVTFGTTVALAGASYRFIEQPFLRLKQRLPGRSGEQLVTEETPVLATAAAGVEE
jgi:peptidoglycan/LPS O-acetylase OafA/YrhL